MWGIYVYPAQRVHAEGTYGKPYIGSVNEESNPPIVPSHPSLFDFFFDFDPERAPTPLYHVQGGMWASKNYF